MDYAMNSRPLVSVIMPLYNSEKYISDAINSILKQSLENFELLILNDGSSDSGAKVVKNFKDPRLDIITHAENKGLVSSLNELIKISRGKYIARMDADDISLPDRLKKQTLFLEKHQEFGMVGSLYAKIDSNGLIQNVEAVPISNSDIKLGLLVKNCFAHGSIMFRRSVLAYSNYPYELNYPHAEDYALWLRLRKTTKMANLSEVLYLWRKHDQSVSSNNVSMQLETVKKLVNNQNKLIRKVELSELMRLFKSALSQPGTIYINKKSFPSNLKREYQFILKELAIKLIKANLIKSFVVAFLVFLISPTNIVRKITHV